jgi:hypothetical protein
MYQQHIRVEETCIGMEEHLDHVDGRYVPTCTHEQFDIGAYLGFFISGEYPVVAVLLFPNTCNMGSRSMFVPHFRLLH